MGTLGNCLGIYATNVVQNYFVIKFVYGFKQIKSIICGAKLESYVQSFKVLLFCVL